MEGFIYKVTNKVTGKSYIGQTRNTVEFRWRQHYKSKDNKYFHRAIQKYGKENFEITTLEKCDVNKLNEREIYYISKYNTFENGYNLTKGGSAYISTRKSINGYIEVDDKYDEIKGMYLAGYSTAKISSLYNVDRHCISNILKSLGVKIKSNNKININSQEFEELVMDYQTGCSLKFLAKKYGCTAPGLKEYLQKKGVDIKKKFSILKDESKQKELINDYLKGTLKLKEIQQKYHCEYKTFLKILSNHGIKQKGCGGNFKLSDNVSLEIIKLFREGKKVIELSKLYKVDKCTIYNLLKRYHVNY
jgi:group I intron endonuclease